MLIPFSSEGAIPPETELCSTALSTQQSSLGQGIQGSIRQLSGNQMLRNNSELIANSSSNISGGSAVQTTVRIFAARIPGNKSPRWSVAEADRHPSLLCRVETDRDGHYSVMLPVGEYTVFAQYGDELYLNAFQSDGSYLSVEVVHHQISQMNITNVENAFF